MPAQRARPGDGPGGARRAPCAAPHRASCTARVCSWGTVVGRAGRGRPAIQAALLLRFERPLCSCQRGRGLTMAGVKKLGPGKYEAWYRDPANEEKIKRFARKGDVQKMARCADRGPCARRLRRTSARKVDGRRMVRPVAPYQGHLEAVDLRDVHVDPSDQGQAALQHVALSPSTTRQWAAWIPLIYARPAAFKDAAMFTRSSRRRSTWPSA